MKENRNTIEIEVEKIKANRYQPRLQFDQSALNELSQSILENGLIQPITVRRVDDHYEIIAGERRFRACVLAGFDKVTCYIMDPSEQSAAQMALVENIQRENLTAIEEAKAYIQIMRQSNLTQDMLAKKLGKSQSTIANKIRLLNLPMEIQEGVSSKIITERHARALLKVDEDKIEDVFLVIVNRKYNVAKSEEYIKSLGNKSHIKGVGASAAIALNTFKKTYEDCKKVGIDIDLNTREYDDYVKIEIKIKK